MTYIIFNYFVKPTGGRGKGSGIAEGGEERNQKHPSFFKKKR